MTEQRKLEMFEKMKFTIGIDSRDCFCRKDVENIYAETARRVEWNMGGEWLRAHDDGEILKMIIKEGKKVGDAYFQRKGRKKMIAQEDLIQEIAEQIAIEYVAWGFKNTAE
ncbi:MAG: hypothetical protein WC309_02370 [Candidatus Paceibacterota bacterium]|jgi:uncharacterized Fe-S cluster-containing radical SAM superfamily protein